YCTWNIAASRTGQSDFDRELGKNSQFNDLYGSEIRSMEKNFTIAIYGTVIIASIIFQGINAIYYFTRKRIMDEYLSKTPPWAIEVIRRTIRT
ncbi:MAG TPA: hypothetical protein PKK48_06825, partial [Phycisphaerae bacterium]|nr:hypothetical protein [Phycisphaerae bacterium]